MSNFDKLEEIRNDWLEQEDPDLSPGEEAFDKIRIYQDNGYTLVEATEDYFTIPWGEYTTPPNDWDELQDLIEQCL